MPELWRAVESGTDCIEPIPGDRWTFDGYENTSVHLCRWGGFILDVDRFYHSFFNILPKHAELMA